MSIERIFVSKTGYFHRLCPSVEPGQTDYIAISMNGAERLLLTRCDEEDSGGMLIEVEEDEFSRVGPTSVSISSTTFIELGDIHPETGVLFSGVVKLEDNDEGLLIIQHNDSDEVLNN